MFSTITGTFNSRPMSDKQFVNKTESAIEDFTKAVKEENLGEMYRIRAEMNKAKNRYRVPSDQAMVLDRLENAFSEEIVKMSELEQNAERMNPNWRQRLQYDVYSDFSEKDSVDDQKTAEITIGKLADGSNVYAPLTDSLKGLGKTNNETNKRIGGYSEKVSTPNTVDYEKILETAKQFKEETKQAVNYVFGENDSEGKNTDKTDNSHSDTETKRPDKDEDYVQ